MESLVIPARSPFRFDLALLYLTRSSDEILDIVDGATHRRVARFDSGPALLEITSADGGTVPAIRVTALTGEPAEQEVRDYVTRFYRLEDDRANLPDEEPLAALLVEHFAGLPLVQ